METVALNGLTLCHKNSAGLVRSTMPDVCRSPSVPVPYTNVAYARTLADGTTTVFSNGGAMNGILGSRFATSVGDEPGTGGGVVSGTNMKEATWLSWSPNVFMQGRPATRLTDKMLMNHGNTVSVGGYYTGPLARTGLLNEICNAACDCQAAGTAVQTCVDVRLTADHAGTNTPTDGVFPEARYAVGDDGEWQLQRDANGMPLKGASGGRAPDVTRLEGGKVAEFVEVKFKNNGDRYRRGSGQREAYNEIGEKVPGGHKTLNFPNDCTCEDNKKQPETVPATEEQEESLADKAKNFAQNHPYLVGGVAVLGILGAGAAIIATGGAAAGPIAALAL